MPIASSSLQVPVFTVAVQKSGELTSGSLEYIKQCGYSLSSGNYLVSYAPNNNVRAVFVRDDDIPKLVKSDAVDYGIVGRDILIENGYDFYYKKDLGFGACTLTLGIPKNAKYNLSDLQNKIIATSYPKITKDFFASRNINIKTFKLNGSVEIAPYLELADAVVDITVTGNTMRQNGLKPVKTVFESEAVLISNSKVSKGNRMLV